MTAKSPSKERDSDVHQEMMDLILGFWVTQTIRAIAALSLADHLAAGGLTATEIAGREGTAEDTTYRLLRAGVGLGLMTADADGRFYATELLATLRKDAPRSLRGTALSFTGRENWDRWNGFVASVKNGPGRPNSADEPNLYASLGQNPEAGREFSAAMTSATSCWSYNIADVIETTDVQRVVDVGGANGSLVRLLQQANPALQRWSSTCPPLPHGRGPTSLGPDFQIAPTSSVVTSSNRCPRATCTC